MAGPEVAVVLLYVKFFAEPAQPARLVANRTLNLVQTQIPDGGTRWLMFKNQGAKVEVFFNVSEMQTVLNSCWDVAESHF